MLRLIVSLVAAVAVLGSVAATVVTSAPLVTLASAPTAASYSYGAQPRQELDAYLPTSLKDAVPRSARVPAVVLVHGGGWVAGDKASMARAAHAAVKSGYVAFAVNYRLAPQSRWPAQRADLLRAIRWIKTNAPRLQVDPERIFVVGSSAGAEIAAGALTQDAGARVVRGVVALSAPLDLELVATGGAGGRDASTVTKLVNDDLLGCGTGCDPLYAERSAAHQLDPRDPPSLLLASRAEWVDPLSSIRFHAAAQRVGLDSTLVLLDGKRHGMRFWNDAWPTIRQWIEARS